uniref:Bpu10I restriction endonuclease alpha subunit n=1 Tax=Bacillus pumilus TaxID=1408 RepID=O52851_BACPU|nr:Bpu10I restriction endonuclease alpha subunit [Bacillus pumilus]
MGVEQEWIKNITDMYQSPELIPSHASNLLHQLKREKRNEKLKKALEIITPNYISYISILLNNHNMTRKEIVILVDALNEYMNTLRHPSVKSVFSHQADFYSSVLPEFFNLLFRNLIKGLNEKIKVNSQKDIIIDCIFDPYNEGRVVFKKKRVDVAIILKNKFVFNNVEISDFAIPLVAIEIKTNLDKNMLSGIEQSVDSLKETFPLCLYYCITELADFAIEKQNYASTHIDEVFILRKQKRGPVRRGTPLEVVHADLILEVVEQVGEHLSKFKDPIKTLKARMTEGYLIKGKGK